MKKNLPHLDMFQPKFSHEEISMHRALTVLNHMQSSVKETKSATMNIFRNFLFSFSIICISRIKL